MRLGMRKMLLLGAGLAVAGSGYAFLASNSLQTAGAGSGTGTVSGYSISSVHTAADSYDMVGQDFGMTYNQDNYYVVTFDATTTATGEPPATEASISFSGYVGTSPATSSTFACSDEGTSGVTTEFSCSIDASAGLMSNLTFADITSYTVTATS